MPKPSSIRSAVSIEHRLVTDRQTDAGPWLVPRMLSIAHKNAAVVRLWTEKCRNAAGLKALVYTVTSFSPQN